MISLSCVIPLTALLFQTNPSTLPTAGVAPAAFDQEAAGRSVSDVPLEAYRLELLELAFQTAATYPENPHVKNRARAIESVALTCYELDQPRRALRYAEDISNWRRGAGYADFACYSAEKGALAEVRDYLERALEVSATSDDVEAQDWRGDRIQAKVARTYAMLGEIEEAQRLETDLDKPAASQVDLVAVGTLDEHEFEAHMATQDELVATGDFELVQYALENYIELFERFYANAEHLAEIEDHIELACKKLPVMIYVEAQERLAGIAADHGDQAKTLELVDRIEACFESLEWRPEDRVALSARLVGLRLRVGDDARAHARLDATVALYDERRAEIENSYRAGALRPIAAAYRALGERGKALEFYRQAVEEGVVNPNLMPRINDLVATCNSMASSAVEPDAALWQRMRAIQAELAARVASSK